MDLAVERQVGRVLVCPVSVEQVQQVDNPVAHS
jgi:hypothetical protein